MSEENVLDHSSQFSLDFARKENLRVVLPTSRELQIDIDSDDAFATFTQAYELLRNLGTFGAAGYSVRPSRSGGEKRHVTVRLSLAITSLERIALQAILGSDWRREMFSIARLQEGQAIPTLFFEKIEEPYPSINEQS
jgi:hypothetical protein